MDEQQLQQQIVQLVQAAMQGNQQATQQIQQIMQAAQQGDQQAAQIAQMIQQVAQQMQQQQVRAAKFGAKLNYIKQLKGQCPDGYKMEYYKKGGQLCKKCMKVHQDGGEVEQTPNTVAERFKMEAAKCGKKMNKKENGGAVETAKCGGKPKLKKKACGGSVEKDKCGSKIEAEKCGGKPKLKKRVAGGPVTKERTETRTQREADGESDSYTVTRKLIVNPATNDSTMTISGRPGQAPQTINNRTTSKPFWNAEVKSWNNSKK